ncbi:MAG: IS5 family transposase [Chloroflexi bacterium]|nr:MAG: IS5 family transposase [Chloroflexota bacterium]
MLTVKEVFHLTNRQTEGFMRSVFQLLALALPVPDHSTLSRRSQSLKVQLPKKVRGQLNLVMDSTGLKIYGEGEWKVRTHVKSKRRTWRKLHLGIDPDSGEIQAAALTPNSVSDDAMAETLLAQIEQPLKAFAGDGSYDTRQVYHSLQTHSPAVRILIPPRKNARIWQHGNTRAARRPRDENLRAIRRQGRKQWKREAGYHVRSLAETGMYRLKTIFGERLSARGLETQTTQALVRCAALNKMTHLGMPQSYRIS